MIRPWWRPISCLRIRAADPLHAAIIDRAGRCHRLRCLEGRWSTRARIDDTIHFLLCAARLQMVLCPCPATVGHDTLSARSRADVWRDHDLPLLFTAQSSCARFRALRTIVARLSDRYGPYFVERSAMGPRSGVRRLRESTLTAKSSRPCILQVRLRRPRCMSIFPTTLLILLVLPSSPIDMTCRLTKVRKVPSWVETFPQARSSMGAFRRTSPAFIIKTPARNDGGRLRAAVAESASALSLRFVTVPADGRCVYLSADAARRGC